MKKLFNYFAIIILVLSVGACNKEEKNKGNQAQLQVRLTDDPALYEAVLIDVQGIAIHTDEAGWVDYALLQPGIYNLLDFSNGLDTLLADILLPPGTLSQIRLKLGSNNSLVLNGGAIHPLTIPSGQESGLKFNIHQVLRAGGSYKVWIDFDAGKSIIQTGNGGYKLKPTIRAYTDETNGRIMGTVLPLIGMPIVHVINGNDTAIAFPNPDGYFMVSGLAAGNYTLWIDGSASAGFNDILLPNVSVTFGNITNVGALTLPPL
jgi:hypothetical protein